jgi:hypothetical protein
MSHVVGIKYNLKENGEPFVYERRLIDKKYAEDLDIPHEVVFNIIINEEGKILKIKRSKKKQNLS